ncbi:MAG: 50S ribosomal protein L24 [Patescibacteria group bacterium]|nr:50S ribosomal protein L24 [Patescibacteria group bacterium]
MKFKKGDQVIVIAGKDKGKEGTIERVYEGSNTVLIRDINMFTKAVKKSDQMPAGGFVKVPRPIDASNVMLKDPKSGKPTRIGVKEIDGKKVRIAKKSGTEIK